MTSATNLMNPLQAYTYGRLSGPKIRLLYLETNQHTLTGRLEERWVSDDIEYYAVSYTWGTDVCGPRAYMLVQDQVIEIGDNLSAFLHSIDVDRLEAPLWIDAICIDQKNESEKVQQIPLMRDIYSAALRTIVWLGPADKVIEESIQALPEINKDLGKIHFDPGTSHLTISKPMPTSLIKHMQGLCSVLIRSWFRRLWIMQEYVLAKEVVFMCGRASTPDAEIRKFIRLYEGHNIRAYEWIFKPEMLAYMSSMGSSLWNVESYIGLHTMQ